MRTIVAIEERNGELTARLSKTKLALPDAKKAVPLMFSADTLPPLDCPANIKAYGDALRNALRQHPAIQSALTNLSVAAPGSIPRRGPGVKSRPVKRPAAPYPGRSARRARAHLPRP